MGKTADNERIKLRATYHNNIAVGMYVTGFVVPFLAIMPKIPQIADFFEAARRTRVIAFAERDLAYGICVLAAVGMAFWGAYIRHKQADEELQKLVD